MVHASRFVYSLLASIRSLVCSSQASAALLPVAPGRRFCSWQSQKIDGWQENHLDRKKTGSGAGGMLASLCRMSALLFVFGLAFSSTAFAVLEKVIVGGVQSQILATGSVTWYGPVGVATDSIGNIYIAQCNGNQIVKIDATTHATTALAIGSYSVSYPQQLAMDSSNNLYIADYGNNRVIEYSTASATVLAVYPVYVPFGIALDASGNIWVAGGGTVSEIAANATSGTSATTIINSGLQTVKGIAFDGSNNLWVSDYQANAVYKYTASSAYTSRSTIFSNIGGPCQLFFDSSANLYLAESANNAVYKFPYSSGYSTSTAIPLSVNVPEAETVAADTHGNLFLTTWGNGIPADSFVIEISTAVASFGNQNVGATSSSISFNFDVFAGTRIGSIKVLDQGISGLEFNYTSTGTTCAIGTYSTTTACSVQVTFTPQYPGVRLGAVELLDASNYVLATAYVKGIGLAPLAGFSPGTVSVASITGLSPAMSGPRRPVFDPQGNLYVADMSNNRIEKIAPNGAATVVLSSSTLIAGTALNEPNAVALDGAGNLYIADGNNSRVVKLSTAGVASVLNNDGLTVAPPIGIAVDGSGNVYVADNGASRIVEYLYNGDAAVVSISGETLSGPAGIAVDGSNNIFVADANNNRIVKIANGVGSVVSTGSLTLSNPRAITLDSPGNIYVSDTGNNRIVEIPSGSSNALSLSTGSATTLSGPIGAAVSGAGDLYIMDAGNNRIVVSSQETPPSLIFDTTAQGYQSADSPQAVSLLNLGNAPLAISVPVSGSNPSFSTGFTNDSSTNCPVVLSTGSASSLAANSSCTLGIDFIPASAGSNSGNVVLTDNSLNSNSTQQSIALSGTATATDATATALTVSASTVLSGGTVTLTATVTDTAHGSNTPTGTVTFTDTLSNTLGNCTLNSGACTTSAETLNGFGSDTITASYGGAMGFASSGGTGAVAITLNSAVGTPTASYPVTMTIATAGTVASIKVLTQGAAGLDFADAGSDTCAMQAYTVSQTCTVNVTFTPKYPGARHGAVELLNSSGNVLATAYISGWGTGPMAAFLPAVQSTINGGFIGPIGVAVDASGNIFVADYGHSAVKEILAAGGYTTIKTLGSGFSYPTGVALDGAGNVFVADSSNSAVKEILAAGGYTTVKTLGSGFSYPTGVALDGAGNVFVADNNNKTVKEILAAGGYTTIKTLYSGVAGSAPFGVALDQSSNIFVADNGNSTVYELMASTGYASRVTLGSGFSGPTGVALDNSGNVFVADYGNYAVKEILAAGGYTTVKTLSGYSWYPRGLALDQSGNLLVADYGYFVVTKLDFADAKSLSFATSTFAGATDTVEGVKTITVENLGNAALSFTSSGVTAPTDFTLGTGAAVCANSGTLAAGGTCTLPIEFTPNVSTTPGALSEYLTLTDNNLNAPSAQQLVALSGTETAPDATRTVLTVSASTVLSGGTVILTATVTDTANNDVSPTGLVAFTDTLGNTLGNCTLISGWCTTSALVLNGAGTDTITASHGGTARLSFSSGTGMVMVAPNSAVGTPTASYPVIVTIATAGTVASIKVMTQGATGLDFADAGSDTCAMQAYTLNQTCTVNVIFTPKYPGMRSGAVELLNSSGNVLGMTYISGKGTGPMAAFSPAVLSTVVNTGFGYGYGSYVAVDASGNLFITGGSQSSVFEVLAAGGYTTWKSLGSGFNAPFGVALDGAGNVFVADPRNYAVKEILAAGGYTTVRTALQFVDYAAEPCGVAVDSGGNLFITTCQGTPGVGELPATGIYRTLYSGGSNPVALALDQSGNIFVADSGNNKVYELQASNNYASPVTLGYSLSFPSGVAVDNNGNVFVAQDNGAVIEIPAAGGYNTVAPLGSAIVGYGLALDPSGSLLITFDNTVQRLDFTHAQAQSFATSTIVGTTDTTDGVETVTVANIGNAALTINNLGTAPTDFTLGTGAGVCANSETLAAGGSCTLPIDFTPNIATTPGVLNENLTLTDNSLNVASAQQLVALRGAAAAVPSDATTTAVALSPTSAMVGQAVNITATVTDSTNASHTPTGAVTIAWTCGTCTVTSGTLGSHALSSGSYTISGQAFSAIGTYTLTASYAGVSGAFLSSSNNSQSSGNRLVVSAVAAATASASAAVNFGSEPAGSTTTASAVTFTFLTAGTIGAPVVVTQGATGLDFADATAGTCNTNGSSYVYSPSATCTVNVTFTPKYPGPRYGAVVLKDGSGNVLATAYINGVGLAPEANFSPGVESTVVSSANSLGNPQGLALDGNGNLYTADIANYAILKTTPGGITTKVLDMSSASFGSHGHGTPESIAVDGAGNLYIGDSNNNQILKESPTGSGYARTIVGSGLNSPSGAAADQYGNVYIANTVGNQILKETLQADGSYVQSIIVNSSVSVLGHALNTPFNVAVDSSGNVYIADTVNNRVIKESYSAGSYAPSLVAGNLDWPIQVVVDGNGNVYFANYGHSSISNGGVFKSILAGGSYAAATPIAKLPNSAQIFGLAVDGGGRVYFSDVTDNKVFEENFQTPATAVFGTTVIDAFDGLDSPLQLQMYNFGNQTLTFATPSSGANGGITDGTGSFTFDSGTSCPEITTSGSATGGTVSSLAANSSCNYEIDFTPQVIGVINGTLTLTDNNLNVASAVQTAALLGAGTAPPADSTATHVSVSPTPLMAGQQATITATVSDTTHGGITPSGGSVAFTYACSGNCGGNYSGTLSGGSAVAMTSGTAVLSAYIFGAAGSYTITATYAGVTSTYAGSSGSSTITVNAATASAGAAVTFGSEPVASTTASTITFTFLTAGTIGAPVVVTQGAAGMDFVDATTGTCNTNGSSYFYSAGATCTVNVTFTPKYPGLRHGAVELLDGSGNVQAMTYINGTGTGPMAAFSSAAQSTLISGLSTPYGVAVDPSGNIFVADRSAGGVKEILAAGGYTTVKTLGSGFYSPTSVALDGAGNVFVADSGNNAVKEILAAGGYTTVKTLATIHRGPTGVAVDSAGNVFVAGYTFNADGQNTLSGFVQEILAAGGYTTVKTLNSGVGAPFSLALDQSGNIFVADVGYATVFELRATGEGYANPVTLSNGFADPTGVVVDNNGNIFVVDGGINTVKEMILAAGSYTTINIPGSGYNDPYGVAFDQSGNLLIADSNNNAIKKLDFADAPALSFATSTIGGTTDTADGVKTVTVENLGNAPLIFTGSGVTAPTDFTLGTGAGVCANSGTVAAGGTCTLPVKFAPNVSTIPGALSENLTLTDNSLNAASAQQLVALSGTALAPPSDATATALTVSASTVVSGGTVTLAATVTDTAHASNTPTGTVAFTDTLSNTLGNCTLSAGRCTTSAVVLNGVGTDTITASYGGATGFASSSGRGTAIVSFSSAVGTPGASNPVTVIITTAGTVASIKVVTQGVTGLDFADAGSDTCATQAYTVSQTCTVNVTFTPKYPGIRYGAVLLEDGSGNVLGTAYLSGVGYGPVLQFQPATVSTSAGNGTACSGSNCGDGGQALSASIPYANTIVFDAQGNTYIPDLSTSTVRKITLAGVISTVAGITNAVCEYPTSACGDGGLGTAAELGGPSDLAIDGAGNLYISDKNANRVRVLNLTTGKIKAFAGTGALCASPTSACGDGGAAISAQMGSIDGMAVDTAGNVYIGDTNDHKIRKVSVATGIISTIAGTGTLCGAGSACGDNGLATAAQINYPNKIRFDTNGNLYIADSSANRIREINFTSGNITTVAGSGTLCASSTSACGDGGLATSAQMGSVWGFALDGASNLYIVDNSDKKIRFVNSTTHVINTVMGTGASCSSPTAACGDGGTGTSAQINDPVCVAFDSQGNIEICDANDHRIRKLAFAASNLSFASTPVGSTSSDSPKSVKIVNAGNAALTFPAPETGLNPSIAAGYTLDASTTCPMISSSGPSGSLAVGASCAYAVNFSPAAVGLDSGSLVLADNNLGIASSGQTISLSGTAIQFTPTITISNIPTSALYGGSFSPTISYNGDGIASFVSNSISKCSVVSGVVHFVGLGTCSLTASATVGTNYAAIAGSAQTFTISQATPTITISNLPSSATFGGDFTPSISYNGDGTASFVSNSISECTVIGGVVHFVGLGTCSLTASATVGTNYAAIAGSAQTFAIGQATPTITISNIPASALYGGSFSPAITYSGDGTASFATNSPTTCSVTAGVVKFIAVGTCSLTASATVGTNYAAIAGSAQTFAIGQATPTITISNIPTSALYGGNITPAITYSGDGTASFATNSPTSCSVTAGVVKFIAVGTCSLTASATVGTNYAAIAGSAQTFTISQATPTITISNLPTSATFGGDFTPAVSYSGDGAASFVSNSISICSVVGGVVHFAGVGTCSLTASATVGTNYAAIAGSAQTFTISQATPTISIANLPASAIFGGDFTPAISYSGDGAASFVSNSISICSVVGGVVHFAGVGTCSLTASATAGTNYAAIAGSAQTFSINQAAPSISISNLPLNAIYNGSFAPTISYNGDGTASFISNSTSICNIVSGAVHFAGVGTCSLTASATVGTNYAAITGSAQTFTISQATPTITISNLPTNAIFGGDFTPAISYNGDGAASFVSNSISICSVVGGVVHFVGAGTCSLTASATAGTDYAVVNGNAQTFAITAATATITLGSLTQTYTGSPLSVSATTNPPGLTVNFTYTGTNGTAYGPSSTPPTGVGSYTVSASLSGNYTGSATGTLVISPAFVNLNFSGTGLAFGSEPVGVPSPAQTLILTNPNGSAVAISSIAASGDFSATSNCPTIAAAGTCSVNVTFAPITTGARTGTLTVTVAQLDTPQTIPLTGTGTAPGILVTPTVLSFGSQVLSTTSAGQSITIGNTGTANLVLSNIVTSGDFAASSNCASVPAGSNCNLTVTFTPTAAGARAGTITFTDNIGGSDQNQIVSLSGTGTVAGATLTPSVLSFPGTVVGANSFVLNTTLTNTGTAALTGISVSVLGDFTQSNTCAATLAPAATCTVSVTYAPTVAGAETGSLNFSDNLGTQTASLLGTGLAPGASLSTAQLIFGAQLVNTSSLAQTIVFTNTGTAAVTIASVTPTSNFTDTTNCSGSIPAGATCSVNAAFNPSTTGSLSGTLTIIDGVGTQVITMQGQGVSPGLSVTPSFEIFGAQEVGATSPAQTLTASNTGTVPLTLNPVKVSGNFSESDQCPATLQAGASCLISLSFSPTATGTLSGSLLLSDAAGLASSLVTVSGQGTLPGIATSPATLSFGSLAVGVTSQAQTVTVTNTGTSLLQIGKISGTGDFAETDTCASQSIAAGSSCVVNVTMTPTTAGTRTGSIQINDNADGAHRIELSGMGQQTGVSIYPTSLAFGSLPFVSSAQASLTDGTSMSVTLINTGNVPLALGGFSTQGDFTESDSCGKAVAVSATCTLTVTFVPTALGHRTGLLTISDNAGGDTQTVSLEGDGSPAGLILLPPVLNFGVQTVGIPSAAQSATLTNNTGAAITNLVITASGEFSESDNCGAALANGAACTLQITVTPTITGAITGTITVSAGGTIATGSRLLQLNALTSGNSALGVVAVTASAIPPGVGLSIPQLSFSATSVGSPSSGQVITLQNTGTLLSLTSLTISSTNAAEFPFTTTCPATLVAQATCTITINFTPTALGLRSGALNITADGGISASLPESGTATAEIDFTLSASAKDGGTSQTVMPGGSANYTVVITPTSGSTFPNAATLTVSGLPSGATATLNTTPWTQLTSTSWQLPANTTLANLSLTLSIPSQSASLRGTNAPLRSIPPLLWGALLLPFAFRLRRAGKRLSRTVSLLLLLAGSMAAMTALSGCGSHNGFFGQPQKSYTITVTVATGNLSHSTNVTLTVQ